MEEFDHGGQRKRMTWLSGPVRTPGTGPEAFYSETLGEGAATRPHFHQVDQFQVFLEGCQQLGSAAVAPVTLHYVDAFTPYGPIVGDETGVHYLTLRARCDPGALFMPESRPLRRTLGGRHASVAVPIDPATTAPAWRTLIEPQPDGLGAEVAAIGALGAIEGHIRAAGGGQVYVVVKGGLRRDGRDHPLLSSLFAAPDEDPGRLQAGPEGMVLLALGFPAIDTGRPNSGLPTT
ncbi:MAG TPA: hypothetical protein VIR58_03545 [Acidimicrobiales bacterium]